LPSKPIKITASRLHHRRDSTAAVGGQQKVIVELESTHLRWSKPPPVEDRFNANPAAASRHIPVNSRS